MKTLFLVRHAKSSWKSPVLSDHDRPLNSRGQLDAPLMATWLKDRGLVPDSILSSTALRALETARIFAATLDKNEHLQLERLLYTANVQGMWRVIESLENQLDTVLLVGHNPALFEFVRQFAPSLEKLPTCAIVGIAFETTDWSLASANKARIVLYEYPKNLRAQ